MSPEYFAWSAALTTVLSRVPISFAIVLKTLWLELGATEKLSPVAGLPVMVTEAPKSAGGGVVFCKAIGCPLL